MPATLEARPRERAIALAAVALIQLGLGLALLIGLRVDVVRHAQMAEQLIAIVVAKPPPPPLPPPSQVHRAPADHPQSAASAPAPIPRPVPNAHPPPTPRIALKPTSAPPAGGNGLGQGAAGSGPGNAGSVGSGEGGGTDMVQIAGSIEDSDMPRYLREARFRGRVSFVFTVEPTGRVDRCSVTRSSGVPELDQLTCRLIVQRFRYRPSTDRNGRPIAEEVDGDEDWGAR